MFSIPRSVWHNVGLALLAVGLASGGLAVESIRAQEGKSAFKAAPLIEPLPQGTIEDVGGGHRNRCDQIATDAIESSTHVRVGVCILT